MSTQMLIYLFVGASFALYIGIALWTRAGSTSEFYVAGGGVHPVVNGMATAADWMSAASFLSMAGLIAFMGYDGSVYLMGWTGGYVVLALLLVVLIGYGMSTGFFQQTITVPNMPVMSARVKTPLPTFSLQGYTSHFHTRYR